MAKRTGLGRGIGALIPTTDQSERPVDVFFPGASLRQANAEAVPEVEADASELEVVPGIHLIQVDPNTIVANPVSRERTSTPKISLSSSTAFVSSVCSSPSWSARTARASTSSSWGAAYPCCS